MASDKTLSIKASHLDELLAAVPPEYRNGNTNYIVSTMENAMQKPVDITDPEMIVVRTQSYMENCIEYGIKPNLPSYALALGMSTATLKALFTDRSIPKESLAALDRGVSMIESTFVSAMLDNRIHPATAIFMLKNHFGYRDESDVTIHKQEHETVDPKTVENRYKSVVGDLNDVIDVEVKEIDGKD